jgi:CelD/BcsL family acetyltransferase involved in cellulose biosynthesis
MSGCFNVEIANSWQAIAPRWLQLQREGLSTPFQNVGWLTAWYGVFCQSPHIEPVLVAVQDARSGKDILLIPLVRRTSRFLRSIEFADLWTADYNAPLIGAGAPELEQDCQVLWNAVLDALPQADIIHFTKMPYQVRGKANPLARLGGARVSDVRGHVVHLPERWEDYVGSLKKDAQKLLRRRWRRFHQHRDGSLRWVSDVAEARRVLAALRAQQSGRLDRLGARHVFDKADYVQFYERYVLSGIGDGSAVLTALMVGDDIVATFLAVADGHSCVLIRSSQRWDDEWTSLGLGKLIIEGTMQLLHARGYRWFDLSIGDFAYKHDFGVEPVPLCDYHLTRTWRAMPVLYHDRTRAALKRNPRVANFIRSVRQRVSRPALPRETA